MPEVNVDKAIRLVEYLEKLASLRTDVVRSVHDYHSVLWFDDVPELKGCFTHAWGPCSDVDIDVWLEVTKQPEPKLPDVPEECEEWIAQSELYNCNNVPNLKESIITTEILYDDEDENEYVEVEETVYLADCQEVQDIWVKYIDDNWNPWAEKHKEWSRVQTVYSKLFTIYQELLKSGEEYELVLGLGLLSWKTPKQMHVKRHLITAKASCSFEAHLGKFIIGPDEIGEDLLIETDMLDIEDTPAKNILETITQELNNAEGNPWDNSTINTVLSSLANTISKDGSGEYYNSDLGCADGYGQGKLNVYYSPALILRKRSTRGLHQLLSKIRTHINSGGKLPAEFSDLAEIQTDGHDSGVEEGDSSADISPPSEVYFPDKSNEEQLSIVHRMNTCTGVIVQGPPGTGKSHTIANLISHLLASGNKVLVTAKTPRALKVLHDKIHEELKPLCINYIGDSSNEKLSLEHSVKSILSEQYTWNEKERTQELDKLEVALKEQKKEKANMEYRIRSIREKDTMSHSLLEGKYAGTASSIAKRIFSESEVYTWFVDDVHYDMEYNVDTNEIRHIVEYHRELSEQEDEQIHKCLPVVGTDMPDTDTFKKYILTKKEYDNYTTKHEGHIDSTEAILIERSDLDIIKELYDKLNALREHVANIGRRPMSWIATAISDMLSDNDKPWKELFSLTASELEGLRDKARDISRVAYEIPEEYEPQKIIEDVKDLIQHLKNGGKFTGLIFKPKIVKQKAYIFDIHINGTSPDTEGRLLELLNILDVKVKIDYLWSMWVGKTERTDSPLLLQVTELEELNEALQKVIEIYDLLEESKRIISKINGLTEPKWHSSDDIDRLLVTCKLHIVKDRQRRIQRSIEKWLGDLHSMCDHSEECIVHELISCIKNLDIAQYTKAIQKLEELNALKQKNIWLDDAIEKYKNILPYLIDAFLNDPDPSIWNERISDLESAWNWKRVLNWVDVFINEDNIDALESNLNYVDNEILNAKASIAKIKAWKLCFDRMSESHRRHLMGWQQAITRLGKGTGKHAPKHRRDAQGNLKKCQGAIPAWIMPLHRVYDTVDAIPELFDVIIVDEASQCGYEALPLSFLCKKLLVVGDNQQISPEAVGIDLETAYRLRKDYLYDFEHADSFDITSSLFDHCNRRFGGGTIVLTEHFRCMPEIIRFSNDLSYANTPLIPLRQYPPKRLAPIKVIHVSAGHKEGKYSNAINRPEAEQIVEKIVELCLDDRYDGKSMGVIVLLGDAQARLIENMLLEEIGSDEYQKRNIICGNPYSFQGDERDIIFMSMVIAPNERFGVLSKDSDRKRMNVAASRAKDQVWLFHSVTPDILSPKCFRKQLLDYYLCPESTITNALGEEAESLRYKAHTANRINEKPPKPYDSWFEVDVILDIASKGYRVIPQYKFARKRIDMVIEGLGTNLAVECYGDYWHGADEYEKDVIRKRQLERCGWTFHIIRECEYYSNPEKSIEQLIKKCAMMGIMPYTKKKEIKKEEQSVPTQKQSDEVKEDNTLSPLHNTLFSLDNDETEEIAISNGVQPNDINEALSIKPEHIRNIIIKILKERPNESCVFEKLPGYILKEWGVITRGTPREKFSAKIIRVAKNMDKLGRIKIYKSKNVRVKLLKNE
ncbi:MAG: AAA family ATPase [Phycisphaerae bacterium]|nr:AAA family ATPase [Phycisphaerae bacterium]